MFELALTTSLAISKVVTIPWVWLVIGVVVWVSVLLLSLHDTVSYKRTEAAVLGSLLGALIGFISPMILMILPFLVPVILAVLLLILIGISVAHFYKG